MPLLPELWAWREDFYLFKFAFVKWDLGSHKPGTFCEDDVNAYKYSFTGKGNDVYREMMYRVIFRESWSDIQGIGVIFGEYWSDIQRSLE